MSQEFNSKADAQEAAKDMKVQPGNVPFIIVGISGKGKPTTVTLTQMPDYPSSRRHGGQRHFRS